MHLCSAKSNEDSFERGIMRYLTLLLFCLTVCLLPSCGGDDGPDEPIEIDELNLYETLQDMEGFDLLQKALTKSGLSNLVLRDDENLTIFAPSDAAFEAFLPEAGIDAVNGEELQYLLSYHLLNDANLLSDLETYGGNRGYLETRNNDGPDETNLSLFFEKGSPFRLNNSASVTEGDIEVKNGVIHIIDQVLIPPNLQDLVAQNPDFDSLEEALDLTLLTELSQAGPNTLFAPLNDGFDEFYSDAGISGPSEVELTDLQNLLLYHVMPDTNLVISDIPADSTYSIESAFVPAFLGLSFNVTVDTVNQRMNVTDFQSNPWTADPVDIQATNGSLHILDGVLRGL